LYAGVDVGGTKTAVVLSSTLPEVIARREFPTCPEQGPAHALDRIAASLRELLEIHSGELISIGVSCGGPLDRRLGVIQSPPNLASWVDVPITSLLSSEFGKPCYLENDANAGAVAEHRYGAGAGADHIVFLTMGTGLGAGIILDGKLYRGATESAGEIGHVRLTRTGPVGYNKAGSVEGWASGGGITQQAAAALAKANKNGNAPAIQCCTAKAVAEAAANGDATAKRIITTAGRRLGNALSILIDVVNPERIVIGGLAMRLGERILAPARQVIRREALTEAAERCEIVPAALGERIGDIAALCVAEGL
jgi:glucokinase